MAAHPVITALELMVKIIGLGFVLTVVAVAALGVYARIAGLGPTPGRGSQSGDPSKFRSDFEGDATYRPGPIANIDWSLYGPNADSGAELAAALEDAGYIVHPLPQRDGWSTRHFGVWREPPVFVPADDEDDRELEPDLSDHEWGPRLDE